MAHLQGTADASMGQQPPTKFKRRMSTVLADTYDLSTQKDQEADEEHAETQPELTLTAAYEELKVSQAALSRRLDGHESRIAQLEASTLPLQITITGYQTSVPEFWHSYAYLSNTEEMKSWVDLLEVGLVLDHYSDKVIILSSSSSRTHSLVQKIRSLCNSYGLSLYVMQTQSVSAKSLRRITKAIKRSLEPIFTSLGMPLEPPWLTIKEPLSTSKADWCVTTNSKARMEQNLPAVVLAKGIVRTTNEAQFMDVTLAEHTHWDGAPWSLVQWKQTLDTAALRALPGLEYMLNIEWSVQPIAPLDVSGKRASNKMPKTEEGDEESAGGADGSKGKSSKGGKGKNKGKSSKGGKTVDSFGNTVYSPKGKGKGKGKKY